MHYVHVMSLTKGRLTSDQVRLLLFVAAQECFVEKKKSVLINEPPFRIDLRTNWKYAFVGSIGGYLFTASIVSGKQHIELDFVVREQDLESSQITLSRIRKWDYQLPPELLN